MLIERYYLCVDEDNNIRQSTMQLEDDEGPNTPPQGAFTFYEVNSPFVWNAPTETSVAKWIDDAPVWVETATLEEIKAKKNSEINAARLAANRSYFTFAGKDIACDELSRSDIDAINGIIAVTNAMPPNWVGGWKAIDNTYVVIPDVITWINFYAAMVQKGSSNFAHAQALKAQLANANSVTQVNNIQWGT